jgi:hypothetical protein
LAFFLLWAIFVSFLYDRPTTTYQYLVFSLVSNAIQSNSTIITLSFSKQDFANQFKNSLVGFNTIFLIKWFILFNCCENSSRTLLYSSMLFNCILIESYVLVMNFYICVLNKIKYYSTTYTAQTLIFYCHFLNYIRALLPLHFS